ncbi:MAG: cytochrome C, partial [Deltaproteobacteria bacterium]|nr:cytochrome C [Deltaproteobacteria bacterium]
MKVKRNTLIYAALLLLILIVVGKISTGNADQTGNGCLKCHQGIESIMPQDSYMMMGIDGVGGDYGPCVVCHGGNPAVTTKKEAHKGAPEEVDAETFYPDPGSLWIADKTCGVSGCHEGYVYRLMRTVKNTEIGKIQGNEWAWGIHPLDRTPRYSNYALDDPDGPVSAVGSQAYKRYIQELVGDKKVLNLFAISSVKEVPNPSPEEIEENPALAAYVYNRIECQRCHVGVRGRSRRGDYRGMGCSACHIPYSNEGFYEGEDPTIKKDKPGHLLAHRIQGSRKTGKGIPVETCTTCHNRGKRIGVSFQGLMESPYGTPFSEKGEGQAKLHTKKYVFIKEDLHHQWESRPENPSGGMRCQDCHTTIEMHGDGNIFGTTLAQVEIECTDCHGTPDRYPWELPLGFMDEFGRKLDSSPRGTTKKLLPSQGFATFYEPEAGYLLTARGNPFGNVVRRGNQVIVHSASGRDYKVPALKRIQKKNRWRSLAGKVAMVSIPAHVEKMECY